MPESSIDEQVRLLMQGTAYGDDSLRAAMQAELRQRLVEADKEGRPLRVYCGFDPRTSDLHIGHMVPIRKMRQFQELGHEVTFLIGRFTSLIGDPSDQDKVREQITLEQATAHGETYAEQAFAILDRKQTKIRYNDAWLSELSFAEVIELTSLFTVQQFLGREAFRQRFEAGDPIYQHEFLYSVMQGYDAYAMKADVQIGGSDQLFNILTAARKLMEALGEKPNIGIILGILPGTDGEIKMSKSLGNHIPLNTTAEDMYGKVMSVPDVAMPQYFRLATRWGPDEISTLQQRMESGEAHPRDVKMKLAREIVEIYYGEEAAGAAEAEFRQVFQEGGRPDQMQEFPVGEGISITDALVESGLVESRTEVRRLAKQGGIRLDEQPVEDVDQPLRIDGSAILQVGKRRFLKLVPAK